MLQDTGTFSYINGEYILAGVKQDLGIKDSTIYDLDILDFINLGYNGMELQTGQNIKAIAQLPIDPVTKSCKLPQGFKEFEQRMPIVYADVNGMAVNGVMNQTATSTVVNSSGNNLGSTTVPFANNYGNFYGPVYNNSAFFKDSPYGVGFSLSGTMEIVNGVMYFSSNVNAQFVKFSYWGNNINLATGEIYIPWYCERALRYFACYKYRYANNMPYEWDYNQWCKGKQNCKAIAKRVGTDVQSYYNATFKSLVSIG